MHHKLPVNHELPNLDHAILTEDNQVVPCLRDDYYKWSRKHPLKKVVKQTTLDDGRFVSTVFLAINHGSDERPVHFETMIFPESGKWTEQYCERYVTYKDALAGHERACTKPIL